LVEQEQGPDDQAFRSARSDVLSAKIGLSLSARLLPPPQNTFGGAGRVAEDCDDL
jgi:hypothetical protein